MPKLNKLEPCSVNELLDTLDYSFEKYKPSVEALKFASFIKEIGEEENRTPLMHLSMMDSVFNEHPRNAILVSRGSGKTALFGEFLSLYKGAFNEIPGFGKTNLSLYISDSIENGVKNLRRNVEFRYANSEYLQWLIPDKKILGVSTSGRSIEAEFMEEATDGGYKFTDVRIEFRNRRSETHITKMYGILTGIKGTKEMGQRPADATFDDIIKGDDAARSPTILQTVKNSIYKDVAYALHPKRSKMIYLGTPYNESDPLYEAIESGSWTRAVYPVAESFDSETTKEIFVGAWEDRFPFEYVKDKYDAAIATGQPQSFFQELMLRITNKDDLLLQDGDIRWYDSTDMIDDNKKAYNFFITTDFSVTAKTSADNSVISVWAVDNNDKIYWVNGFIDKCTIDKSINALFMLCNLYNPMMIGIERSGQQGAIVTMIEQAMRARGSYFPLARSKGSKANGINVSLDKVTRFNSVIHLFRMGRVFFPENKKNMKILKIGINEISSVSSKGYASKHDDFGDTVAMLSQIELIKPDVRQAVPIEKQKSIIDLVLDAETNEFAKEQKTIMDSYLN